MKHVPIYKPGQHGLVGQQDIVARDRLERLRNAKQAVEWRMAKRLLDEFDNPSSLLHNGLKGMVFNAMDDIEDIWRAKGDEAIRMAYYKDVKNYEFVKKMAPEHKVTADAFAMTLADRTFIETLNAAGLGSLIRFYGEVIEAGKTLTTKPAPSYLRKPAWDADSMGKVNIPQQNWGQPTNTPSYDARTKTPPNLPNNLANFFDGHERQMRTYQKFGAQDPDHDDMGFWDKTKAGFRRREEVEKMKREALEAFHQRQSKVERALCAAGGGISLFVQLPADLLNKMDLAFGLSHGATISGTTADTMYFINRMSVLDKYLGVGEPNVPVPPYLEAYFEGWDWQVYQETGQKYVVQRNGKGDEVSRMPYFPAGKRQPYSARGFRGLDPVYYMLPLGIIVGGAHHTTTEVALPLALNLNDYDRKGTRQGDVIFDYAIGMYKGLMPKRGSHREHAPGLGTGEIDTILADAENDPKNELVLIYYDAPEKPGGYVTFDRNLTEDMAIWNQVAKAAPAMMNTFKVFHPYPTRNEIASLHPAIKALIGESIEKPKFVPTGAQDQFAARREQFERAGKRGPGG